MATTLSSELAFELAAPSSRYSKLLALGQAAGQAVALFDSNGDGAQSETVHLYVENGRWHEGSSSGGGTPDRFGLHATGSWYDETTAREVRYAYGRVRGPGKSVVDVNGLSVDIVAGAEGWWVWVEDPAEPHPSAV